MSPLQINSLTMNMYKNGHLNEMKEKNKPLKQKLIVL